MMAVPVSAEGLFKGHCKVFLYVFSRGLKIVYISALVIRTKLKSHPKRFWEMQTSKVAFLKTIY